MAVRRIVANIASDRLEEARSFYCEILDLEPVMDHGWIVTYGSNAALYQTAQISIASEGGSGTPVPDLSLEVDNFDDVVERVKSAGLAIEYGPTAEPWGVRRFFLRDPFGRLLNILSHR
ncbi:VOC family protein [Neorhizobium alkalisoli]|uniref:Extradiol dioxygenase family protein n=1 Tax=Neorhizobium alkalisoli TaxID=528178 RepID=A0A561R1F9_9HYPH|nr:VOC family protein [Neorhizobium alkalisoli]TWF56432.1 extradiol dioxygenase family protein [Neorhizobium alkalisoli]